MKIAFDHQIFTMQSYGGISRYYAYLAEEMLAQGHIVDIHAGLHRNHYLSVLPENVVYGRKLNKYPRKTGRFFNWTNHGLSQYQMMRSKPDIIHETYYSSLPHLNTKSVRVTTVYDMIHELYANQFSPRDKTTSWKKNTFDRVDHILSISESTKRDLIELFGIDEEKVSVVYLGVDPSSFKSIHDNIKYSDKPYLLYVGGRGTYKNFTGFIKSVAASSNLFKNFNVIAFGGGQFNFDELELISKLGFSSNQVKQLAGPDSLLAQLYTNAAAFVYPSLYEGFGLPPLEAMAAGCPVVSSNASSMPEVVRDAGMYFNPNEIEDMREAIEKVVFSESLKSQLISSGYENIKDFSWDKCAQETLDIYKKLKS